MPDTGLAAVYKQNVFVIINLLQSFQAEFSLEKLAAKARPVAHRTTESPDMKTRTTEMLANTDCFMIFQAQRGSRIDMYSK